MIREVFQDAESVRSEQSHVPSQPALFPPFRHPGGMHSRSLGMPSRNDKPPDIWDTHGKSANVFVNPTASSSGPYPQESNPWVSNVSEHTSPHVMSQSQTPSSGTLSASRSCSRDDVETHHSADVLSQQTRVQLHYLHAEGQSDG